MNKKPKDRHLDVPAEANRDKHINYLAREEGDKDPASENTNKPFDTDNPLRESRKTQDHNKDDKKKREFRSRPRPLL